MVATSRSLVGYSIVHVVTACGMRDGEEAEGQGTSYTDKAIQGERCGEANLSECPVMWLAGKVQDYGESRRSLGPKRPVHFHTASC